MDLAGGVPFVPIVVLIGLLTHWHDLRVGLLTGRVEVVQACLRWRCAKLVTERQVIEVNHVDVPGLARRCQHRWQLLLKNLLVGGRIPDFVALNYSGHMAEVCAANHHQVLRAGIDQRLGCRAYIGDAALCQYLDRFRVGKVCPFKKVIGRDEYEVKGIGIRLVSQGALQMIGYLAENASVDGGHPGVVIAIAALGAANCIVGQRGVQSLGQMFDGGRAIAPAPVPIQWAGQLLCILELLRGQRTGDPLTGTIVRLAVSKCVDVIITWGSQGSCCCECQ